MDKNIPSNFLLHTSSKSKEKNMHYNFCRLIIVSVFFCFISCSNEVDRSVRDAGGSQKLKVCNSKLEKSKEAIQIAQSILKEIQKELYDVQGGKSYKKPSFHALLTKTTTLGKRQIVVFDKVVTNNGNAYDALHGLFTAPRDGTYFFTSSFRSSNGNVHLEMVKNEAVVAIGGAYPGHGATGSMSATINLKKNDKVKLRHWSPASAESMLGDHTWSMFTGFML